MFEVLRFDQSYKFYRVYISAFNGAIWSNPASIGTFLTLSVEGGEIVLPNVSPSFIEPVDLFEIDLNSNSSLILPEIYDMNNDPFSISITGLPSYMSLSLEDFSITVDET